MGLGAGQIATEADLQAIIDGTIERPVGRLVASGTIALADSTQVVIPFSTEEYDSHGYHSTSVNNSRVTPLKAGVYEFRGTVFFQAQTTPVVSEATIKFNGTTFLAPAGRGGGLAQAFSYPAIVQIEMNGSTDYIELFGMQDSAGADNTNQSSQYSSTLEWTFIRDPL